MIFLFKQKTAYDMRISDWSSDVCSSDLDGGERKVVHDSKLVARRCHGVGTVDRVGGMPRPFQCARWRLGRWWRGRRAALIHVLHRTMVHGLLRFVTHRAVGHRAGTCSVFGRRLPARRGMAVMLTVLSRSEEHTSELQSLMRISYAVF